MSIIPLHFQILQGLIIGFGLFGPRPVIQLPSFSLPSFEMLNLRPVQLLSLPSLSSFELNGMPAVFCCLAVLVLGYLYFANAFVKPSSTTITLTPIAPQKRFPKTDYLPLAVATPLSRSRLQTSQPIRSPGEAFPIKFGVSQLSVAPGYYHQPSSLFSRPSTLASSTTPKLEQIIHNAKVDQLSDSFASLPPLSRPDVEPVNDAMDPMSISRPHIINDLSSMSISFEEAYSSHMRSRRAANEPVFMPTSKTGIVDPARNDFNLRGTATPAKPSLSRRLHTSTAQRKVAARRRRHAATPKEVLVAQSTPPTSTPSPRAPAQPATPVKPSSGRRLHTSTSSKKVASRRRRLATSLSKSLQESEVSSSITQTSTHTISIPARPRGILKSNDSSSVRVPKNVHFEEFQIITVVPRVDDDSVNWPFRGQPYRAPHRVAFYMRPLRLTSSSSTPITNRSVSCGKVGHTRIQVDGKWCCSLVESKRYIPTPRLRR